MKSICLFVAVFCFLAVSGYADSVNLEWDASVDAAGYEVYARDYLSGYNYSNPVCTVTELSCTATVSGDRQTAFVARAWTWGAYDLDGNRNVLWSSNSNEVTYVPEITPPSPPQNFVVRIFMAIINFFRGLLG